MAEPMDVDGRPYYNPPTSAGTKRAHDVFAADDFVTDPIPQWMFDQDGKLLSLNRKQQKTYPRLARELIKVERRLANSANAADLDLSQANISQLDLAERQATHYRRYCRDVESSSRIVRIFAGICLVTFSLFNLALNLFRRPSEIEIAAVDTNSSGSKRRAIGVKRRRASQFPPAVPGAFPTPPPNPSPPAATIYSPKTAPGSAKQKKAMASSTNQGQSQLETPPQTRPNSSMSQPIVDSQEGHAPRSGTSSPVSPSERSSQYSSSPPDAQSTALASSKVTNVHGVSTAAGPSNQRLRNTPKASPPVRRLAPPTVGMPPPKKLEPRVGDSAVDELIERLNTSMSAAATTPEEIEARKQEQPVFKYYELLGLEDPRFRLAREANEEHEYYKEKDERALETWRVKRARDVQRAIKQAEESRQRARQEAEETARRIEAKVKEAAARAKSKKAADKAVAAKAARAAEEARLAEEARIAEEARLAEEAKRRDPKQQLIRPLDPEWNEEVEKVMDIKKQEKVITKTVDGAEITRSDMGSLVAITGPNGDNSPWLNDEIVNGVVSAIVARKLEKTGYIKGPQSVPAYASYPSMWYTNVQNKGIKSIENWSRRKGIKGEKMLGCEKIFFPVNTGAHWMLLIISPKAKTIEFLDSLSHGGKGHQQMFGLAREWLQMELGKDYVESEWENLTSSKSARQRNSDDCGVFTCFNAVAAAKGKAFEEVGEGSMIDARRILAAVLINGGFKDDFEL